jgi:serpin B
MKTIVTPNAPAAIGPYSQAIEANGFVYCSGQLPIDPTTGTFPSDDIKEQTHQSLRNAQAILREAGLDLDNVVKTTVLLADIADFGAMNEVYAEMFKAPFNDETIRQINDWVNKKTDSMIPEMIKQFGENTVAVLLNSIAFDAEWKNNYEKNDVNENGEFTLENGKKVKCSLMNSMEKGYIRDGSAEGFIKKYKGEKYAFMAILPDKGVSLSDYVRSLTAEKFARLYNSRNNNESVIASLPKFKYDYSTCLNDPLKQMGIADVFDPSKSDLSGITDRYKMYISNVAHKTHIEVNEQGTKAAAATEIQLDVSGALPADMHTVSLDRPFVYAIMDTTTGLPVYLGTVCDPSVN